MWKNSRVWGSILCRVTFSVLKDLFKTISSSLATPGIIVFAGSAGWFDSLTVAYGGAGHAKLANDGKVSVPHGWRINITYQSVPTVVVRSDNCDSC
jgi:hypothetical protein